MRLTKKSIALIVLCAALLALAVFLTVWEFTTVPSSNEAVPPAAATEADKPATVTIELVAAGDNLMHMPIVKSQKTDTGYNFDGIYENIKKYLDGADLKIINQETIFINDPSRYSGYPAFGTPCAVGDSLVSAGFNVIQQASNHTYDKGLDGINDTLAYWKTKPVTLLGINETPESALRIDKFTKDGFSVALMNYTYGLNGFTLPSGKEYLVDMLSDENRDAIAERIARAKAECDLVVMLPHWGTEYSTVSDDFQQEWLEFFNQCGVDVVIGTHPHVLQPYEEYVGENGYKTIVYYSLGNFVSNQDSVLKELGGLARLTLVKDENGAYVREYSMIPVFTHVSGGKYTVYALEDYTDELAATHAKYGGSLRLDMIQEKYESIVGDKGSDEEAA